MLTNYSSFKDLIKAWKKSPANMGIEISLSFYTHYGDGFNDSQFFKAEKILWRKHKKAFLAWLKLQQ